MIFDYLLNQVENKIGFLENEEDISKDYKFKKDNPIHSVLKASDKEIEFEENYFLTFNYTSKILLQYYFFLKDEFGEEKYPIPPIHIHGNLDDKSIPIIFGYGDEYSSEYIELEKQMNNSLLTNFKTFQYLRSSEYNRILGLIANSNDTYVQIIGHSCGLCDKALLRTIFHHENVKKIEVTYHMNDSKYFENIYNVSRIFEDNVNMRSKIMPLIQTSKIE